MGSEAGGGPPQQPSNLDSEPRRRTGHPAHRAIGAWSHGIIDYVIFVLLITGPSFAGFTGRQAALAYLFGAVIFVMTICTRMPLGIFKVVGFAMHGAIELIVGILILIMPWLANFSRGVLSRDLYVAIGMLMLIVWALTDFRGVRDRPTPRPRTTSAP